MAGELRFVLSLLYFRHTHEVQQFVPRIYVPIVAESRQKLFQLAAKEVRSEKRSRLEFVCLFVWGGSSVSLLRAEI